MCRECLPERESFPDLWDALVIVVDNLDKPEIWPALYVRWEAGLLSALGYGLDLTSCAATGRNDELTHVSPRSGRAVSASAAEPYLDKLLALPSFMRGQNIVTPDDVYKGLKLTAYFLETRVQWNVNRTLPEARATMIERLMDTGISCA